LAGDGCRHISGHIWNRPYRWVTLDSNQALKEVHAGSLTAEEKRAEDHRLALEAARQRYKAKRKNFNIIII
jgi:hypothetical protein